VFSPARRDESSESGQNVVDAVGGWREGGKEEGGGKREQLSVKGYLFAAKDATPPTSTLAPTLDALNGLIQLLVFIFIHGSQQKG